jgi:hypothetical protein
MLNFQNNNIPGELWLRSPEGVKEPAPLLLQNVYAKYQTITPTLTSILKDSVYFGTSEVYNMFYNDLTSNRITRFDSFYDCIFVETQSGCIFEKIYTEDNQIKPFSVSDNFTAKHNVLPGFLSYDTYTDYWLDEASDSVYYAYISSLKENKDFANKFAFAVVVNVFDCKTGLIRTVMLWKVVLGIKYAADWDVFNYIIETPKITFNSSTRTFNISFLLKNTARQFGLISINFRELDTTQGAYEITEVNGHVPFFTIDPAKCEAYPYNPHDVSHYRVVTVSTDKNDPSYDLKFIKMVIVKDRQLQAKYLIIE